MTQNQDVNRLIAAAGAMKVVSVSVATNGDESIGGGASAAKQDEQTALLTPKPYTDAPSSTITLGGTAQTILAANTARTGVTFYNVSDTKMWLNNTGLATAGAGSFPIEAGGSYVTDYGAKDSQAISILCATTGKAYTCKWW